MSAFNYGSATASTTDGPWIKNPKHLNVCQIAKGSLLLKSGPTAVVNSGTASFFTAMAARGVQSSITAADTYITLANLSGGGFAFNFVSPTHDGGAFTPTFRITVDGTQYVLSSSTTLSPGKRVVLGPICNWPASTNSGATATTAVDIGGISSPLDQGFSGTVSGNIIELASNSTIAPPEVIQTFGMQSLRFDKSLLVEMKVSGLSSVAVDKQCAVTYRLDL